MKNANQSERMRATKRANRNGKNSSQQLKNRLFPVATLRNFNSDGNNQLIKAFEMRFEYLNFWNWRMWKRWAHGVVLLFESSLIGWRGRGWLGQRRCGGLGRLGRLRGRFQPTKAAQRIDTSDFHRGMPRHCLIHAATTRNKTRPGRPTNEKMKTDNEQEHAEKQMEKNRKTRTRKRMPLLSSLFFSLLLSSSLFVSVEFKPKWAPNTSPQFFNPLQSFTSSFFPFHR